ncbi:MAG: GAF domain-containing protein [Bryobacterales bacterium]|nr:GAF domain-containing protein [Bryobacterales bacterium]
MEARSLSPEEMEAAATETEVARLRKRVAELEARLAEALDEQSREAENRSSEAELRLSELREHFRHTVEASPFGIALWSRGGELLQANDALLRIVGRSWEEMPKQRFAWETITPAEYHALEREKLKELSERGTVAPFEKEYIRPDGTRVAALVGAAMLPLTGDFVVYVVDISEQKKAQRELLLLVEASAALMISPYSSEVMRTTVDLAQRFVEADGHAVWRATSGSGSGSGNWVLSSWAGLSEDFASDGILHAPASAMPRDALLFEDVTAAPMLAARAEIYQKEGVRSLMAIPLCMGEEVNGTVVFYWRKRHAFQASEVRIAKTLGNLAATALSSAQLYERQTMLRAAAQSAQSRAAFLVEAGEILTSSLEYETTLKNVARMAVPRFADWCSVDLVTGGQKVQRVAVEHSDPNKARIAFELVERYPQSEELTAAAIRTNKSFLLERITDELLSRRAQDEEHLRLMRELGLSSLIVVPITSGKERLGVISFVTAESRRRYNHDDLQLAEEIGRRAATAIAHARLYETLRSNEERLRLAVSAAALGVWERDLATGALSASEQCKRNVGADPEKELSYEDLAARIHEQDLERWQEASRIAVETTSIFECEYRIWFPDGALHWVLAYGRCLYAADGRPLRMVGVTLDVTERKKSEQERRDLLFREREARQTAELLNRIGPALASELDVERLIQSVIDIATILAGAEFGGLFYTSYEEGKPQVHYSLSGMAKEVLPKLPSIQQRPIFDATFRAGRTIRMEDVEGEEEYREAFRSMGIAARSYLAVPVISRSAEVLGALVFGHGAANAFSERHEELVRGIAAQAAIALDNARLFEQVDRERSLVVDSNRALERTNDSLRQFAYAAAHDLKEPLRMVSLYSELLGRQYASRLDDGADEFLNYIRDGALRMQMLVDDLLAFTQAGDIADKPASRMDLNEILDIALSNLSVAIAESGAEITRDKLPKVTGHEVPLVQLFQNLAGNAIRYRKPGQIPRIRVSAEARGKHWLISVEDNGIGIAPEYHKQVFGVFKRLNRGTQSGTGIGLAICQRVVERYGGSIWVESEEGRGATFRFTLPREG